MHEIAPPMQLSRMIDNLFQNDKFKSAIFNDSTLAIRLRLSFQKIRELGNKGVHGASAQVIDAVRVLQEVMDLFDWYGDTPKRLRAQHHDALVKFLLTKYDKARKIWVKLDSLGDRLPHDLRFNVLYSLACTDSRIAEDLAVTSKTTENDADSPSADTAFSWLKKCVEYGNKIGWADMGESADAAMASISADDDLLFIRNKFGDRISELLRPTKYGSNYEAPVRGASGKRRCVVAGSPVLTLEGIKRIEDLEVGNEILALDLSGHNCLIGVEVTRIDVDRAVKCIRVNNLLTATPTQPVYEAERQWVLLADVRPGMRLLRGDGSFASVDRLEELTGLFSVYEISTDHPSHNFIASSYVCHNVKE
jgi:hypothetical protein